jgi:GTP-binding protein
MALVTASFLKSCADWRDWPTEDYGPCLAFWGRSNVGKSSLLNALLGSKAARVSKTPGRTQLLNLFVSTAALKCLWCDLPGYGYASTSQKTAAAIAERLHQFLLSDKAPQLLCWLIDARHGLTKSDWEILPVIEELLSSGTQVIIVSTKNDKLSKSQQHRHLELLKKSLPPVIAAEIEVFLSSGHHRDINQPLESYLCSFVDKFKKNNK